MANRSLPEGAEALAVDWSGARNPAGRIWVGAARAGRLFDLQPAASRQDAVDRILERGRDVHGPLAVGLDFAFSMPLWFLRQHRLDSARALWQLVAVEGERWLASCDAPFWGRPGRRRPELEDHLRRTEHECEPVAGIRPKSVFQIGGVGAVGTGSLRGMPHLLQLSDAGFAIWPFDPSTRRTVFEVYPRLCTGPVTKSDPAARRAALAKYQDRGAITRELLHTAVASEDAFDAAVTAIVMSQSSCTFARLPEASDDVERLEGRMLMVEGDW